MACCCWRGVSQPAACSGSLLVLPPHTALALISSFCEVAAGTVWETGLKEKQKSHFSICLARFCSPYLSRHHPKPESFFPLKYMACRSLLTALLFRGVPKCPCLSLQILLLPALSHNCKIFWCLSHSFHVGSSVHCINCTWILLVSEPFLPFDKASLDILF